MMIARKIFFPIFLGGGHVGGTCPLLPPVSYAYGLRPFEPGNLINVINNFGIT